MQLGLALKEDHLVGANIEPFLHTHTHTHTHTHARTHARTHTHTHTLPDPSIQAQTRWGRTWALREMEKGMQLGLALKENHLVGAQNQAVPSHTHTPRFPHTWPLPASATKGSARPLCCLRGHCFMHTHSPLTPARSSTVLTAFPFPLSPHPSPFPTVLTPFTFPGRSTTSFMRTHNPHSLPLPSQSLPLFCPTGL
jgi:hypothetical protein